MAPRPQHYDVVTVSDLRLPGGTSASIAEELAAQELGGLTSGLIQVDSRLVARQRPLSPRIRARLEAGIAELITGRARVPCDLLILRHPTVMTDLDPARLPEVDAKAVVLVANQSPGTPTGSITHYDPRTTGSSVEAWLGVRPLWRPIGPQVRENLQLIAPDLDVAADDWVNIIDLREWPSRHLGRSVGSPIVIGRHSRDHRDKWPADPRTLRAAYPSDRGFAVEVLGGAEVPREVLGGQLPANWTVHPFGSMSPQEFLPRLDFLVYFHHPDWVEAFGRTVLEALAAGVVPVLPEAFRTLFGPAAVYTTPDQVRTTLERLASDPEALGRVRQAGHDLVGDCFSYEAHLRRLEPLLGRPVRPHPSTPPEPAPPKTRVLFVSSNGAGVGHLMRLMSMARRASTIEPIFLTLSQAIDVVHQQGFPVEYLPSRQYLGGPAGPWHEMLRSRLCHLIDQLGIRAVVFDGTWPYQGLLDLKYLRPDVALVWSRRAMWKQGITSPGLDEVDRFSLVIEPGEFAAAADRGVTSRLRHQVTGVGPITFLDPDDRLDREDARRQLGLDPHRPAALIQLGAGNIDDTTSLRGLVVSELLENGVQVCITRSAIAAADPTAMPADVHQVGVYPLARYLAAFDLAVAASGYNTYHELIGAALPTVFVPNLETATDDQLARARYAEEQGVGRCVTEHDHDTLREALAPLLDETTRARMHERASTLRRPNGAGDAVVAIEELVKALEEQATKCDTRTTEPAARRTIEVAEKPGRAAGTTVVRRAYTTSVAQIRTLRARVAAITTTRVVRRLAGAPFRLLPTEVQRAVRRRLRRWSKAPSPNLLRRLPVPPGAITPDEDEPLTRIGFWLDDTLGDDTVTSVVRGVAGLQVTYRGFVPIFITTSRQTSAFRDYGFLFEYLPEPGTWPQGDAEYRRYIDARIADIVQRYRPAHLAHIASIEDAARFVRPLVDLRQ